MIIEIKYRMVGELIRKAIEIELDEDLTVDQIWSEVYIEILSDLNVSAFEWSVIDD